jgi:hypothetical protein
LTVFVLFHYLVFFEKFILSILLIVSIPMKKTSNKSLLFGETSLTLKRIYPINGLKHAHNVLTNGEERPFPGGLENGVGNLSP